MTRINATVPVVVLGFHYGGLGVARSLGRLGVRVHGVDRDRRAPGFASRYCRTAHVWDCEQAPVADTLSFLDDLGKSVGRAVLIPTSDAAAVLVAEHADELAPRFLFPRPSPRLVRALTDKREVFRLAQLHGVPTPAVSFPQSRDDVLAFLSRASFPVMLKAINPTRLERRTGHRLLVANTPEALLRRYAEWEEADAPNLMLQEYVPGDDTTVWMFNGVFNEWSECVAAFTGQKLRQHPAHGGATSLGVCAVNPEVARLTIDFMWALRYQGVLDIGFRYDARDGLYKLLDPNPRLGATFRLFVDEQGMDVARFLYLDLTGQPAWLAPLRAGRKWIVEDADLGSSLVRAREGGLTLRGWVESVRGVEEGAWFARDDLRPLWRMSRRIAGRALRGAARRLGLARLGAGLAWLGDAWGRVVHRRIKSLLGAVAFGTGLHRVLLRGRAVIVLFHRVGEQSGKDGLWSTAQAFSAYCDFFERYFRVISLGELIDRLASGKDVSHCLVITFDDGYRDNHDVAAAELTLRRLPACFFVTTELLGSRAAPTWATSGGVKPVWMSWDEVRALAARGFEIGSHTMTHVDLSRAPGDAATREILGSKSRLERELGAPVRHFSYPFGERDQITEANRAVVRMAGFQCCLSAYGGLVTGGADPFHLQRQPVSAWYVSPTQFGFELLNAAMERPLGFRHAVPERQVPSAA
jgi:D-aspartate ligase